MIKNNIEIDVKVKCIEKQTTQAELAKKTDLPHCTPSYVNCFIKSPDKIVNNIFVKMIEHLGYDIELNYVKR